MEVLYHIRSYFVGIFPYILPYIGIINGGHLQFGFLKWPLSNILIKNPQILHESSKEEVNHHLVN